MSHALFKFQNERQRLKDFGIFQLTIREAAELIAIDAWMYGLIESDSLRNLDLEVDPSDPQLKFALSKDIDLLVARLVKTINAGVLRASRVSRNPDESLDPDDTYIEKSALIDWMSERGYQAHLAFAEWEDIQEIIHAEIEWDVATLQAVGRSGLKKLHRFRCTRGSFAESKSSDEVPAATLSDHEQCIIENLNLKDQLTQLQNSCRLIDERPVAARERQSLLATIAILCNMAELDVSRRAKTAGVIRQAAEQMGLFIGESTIENQLKRIPDVLAARTR